MKKQSTTPTRSPGAPPLWAAIAAATPQHGAAAPEQAAAAFTPFNAHHMVDIEEIAHAAQLGGASPPTPMELVTPTTQLLPGAAAAAEASNEHPALPAGAWRPPYSAAAMAAAAMPTPSPG